MKGLLVFVMLAMLIVAGCSSQTSPSDPTIVTDTETEIQDDAIFEDVESIGISEEEADYVELGELI